ncbi:MAG: hypothetical protein AAGG81_04450, partial [Chlamydiota bacterium]
MDEIVLKNVTQEGVPLEVTYLPGKGMNMVSYKKGDIEVMDLSTTPLFEERYAGLGSLIGPHFHKRKPEVLPVLSNEDRFPHIARIRGKSGNVDPFSHGVGRYAPWTYEATEHSVKATLTGKDEWNGVLLKDIENQDFKMEFQAELQPDGLHLNLSVVSDSDSVVGLHYYYALPKKSGVVRSKVQNNYIAIDKVLPIPGDWGYDQATQELNFTLDNEADYTFHPFPDATQGEIILDAVDHQLKTSFVSDSEECCFQ